MGLRAKPGGFGTPEFEGRVARIEGDLLVLETGENVATQTISTVRAAAEFFGVDYHPLWFEDFKDQLPPMDPDAAVPAVDVVGALAIADWFQFGTDVLARLRGYGLPDDMVSETQIWPEHFDAAIEMGDEGRGQRASFGASPEMRLTPNRMSTSRPGARSTAPIGTGMMRRSTAPASATTALQTTLIRLPPCWRSCWRATASFTRPEHGQKGLRPSPGAAACTICIVSS